MNQLRKILALLLVSVLLLTGCGLDTQAVMEKLARQGQDVVHFSDMVYTRPDMGAVQSALDAVCQAAEGSDLDAIIEKIYDFYDLYDSFNTNYALADIHYCQDLTDLYWSGEYDYCLEHCADVDAALEKMYYALAKSPCREQLESEDYFGPGYFDSYEGENLWDESFMELLTRETELQSRYYDLSEAALDYDYDSEAFYEACGAELMEVLVELIRVRQQQAACWGYSSYPEFAAAFSYCRDYTTAQTDAYLEAIREELVPLYRQINTAEEWESLDAQCTEEETFRYVSTAADNMDGTVEAAFDMMERAGLYDIRYGGNKYDISYETYLTGYAEPFVFLNPTKTRMDCLSFAHEFGHFCSDYASFGSYAGIDVQEVFSQGMEYLSLCYGENTQTLTWLKMADSLCTYVEQAAFARFEQEMYSLTGSDLTAEKLCALYERIALEYGFDCIGFDSREFVNIDHFYTNPMYVISYVVSNDAAMQLYQMERQESGTGLRCFEDHLDTQAVTLLEFLDSAGLESPFAEGRVKAVAKTLEEAIK